MSYETEAVGPTTMSAASIRPSTRPRTLACAAGILVSAALVAAPISPAWATSPSHSTAASSLLDEFALGGDVSARIDERSGGLTVDIPLGGLGLRWDSRAAPADRFELGPAWGWAETGHVDVRGAVRAFTPAGGAYEADAASPTGLLGYTIADVDFSQEEGTLPIRDDELVEARPFRFTLSELGGATTSFDHDGNPITRMDAFENRIDWVWQPGTHLLERRVDPHGVVSSVDRSDPALLRVTTGAEGATFEVGLAGGRVSSVRDAVGRTTTIGYDDHGRLARVRAPSGALTDVSWQHRPDGSVTVDQLRVSDAATGEVVAARDWSVLEGSASGWPFTQRPGEAAGSSALAVRSRTHLGDGTSSVESTYTLTGLLTARELGARSASGTTTLSRHEFTYPTEPEGAVPGRFSRPTEATTTWFSAAGTQRSVTEQVEYDAQGRILRHTAGDGSVTETEYDAEIPAERRMPPGLPRTERTTAPDGIRVERRYELTPERTAVAAVERFQAAADEEDLTRTARTEYDVQADGFVSAEREFPQGGDGVPVVTARERTADRDAGTLSLVETRAAGTAAAATTVEVSDLAHGALLESTDAAGNVTTFERDAVGRELARTDAAGLRTTTAYASEPVDGVTTVTTTRADELATTEHRDVLGRPVRMTDNVAAGHPVDGHTRVVETRSYPDSMTESVTDAWGATTTTRHDALGRVVETSRPTGLVEVTRYDDAANTRTTGITPTGRLEDAPMRMTETVNLRGDATQVAAERADGLPALTRELAYDGLGRQRSVSDGVAATDVEFDAYGNAATTIVAPTGHTPWGGTGSAAASDRVIVSRSFDPAGVTTEQTRMRDAESRSGGIRALDELGRTVTETDQAGRATTSEYTADGLLTRRTTWYGQVTEHTYDEATRRLTQRVVSSPIGDTVRTAYEYDRVLGTVTAVFDPADRARTEIATEYDAHGNPTRVTYPDGSGIEHRYDEHGRRIGTTDVAGNTTSLAYDDAGRLTETVQRDAGGDELARTSTSYDRLGYVAAITRGNGVTSRYEHTSAGQVSRERTTDASGATLAERMYDYDPRGNLLRRADRVRNPGDDAGELAATTTTYRYDIHDQLIGSTVVEGASEEQPSEEASVISRTEYVTTVSGDVRRERTELRPGTAEATSTERTYDYSATGAVQRVSSIAADGVSTVDLDHDAAGNLVRGADGTRYAYNAANRQVAEIMPDGRMLATAYWADGQRSEIATTDEHAGAATRYYWDGGSLVNEVHRTRANDGERTAAYLLGDGRHARTVTGDGRPDDAPATTYVLDDRHGNVVALSGADGAIAERYEYDDYGATSVLHAPSTAEPDPSGRSREAVPYTWAVGDATANPFTYAGEYLDPTGTQFLQTRTYDAELRQFTSADTELLHNRYAYADLNPIMRVDPTGRDAVSDWFEEIEWAGIMQAPWFKVLTSVLAIVLTAVGFYALNTPYLGASLSFVIGFWGGVVSGVAQGIGATMLTLDAVNSLIETPYWDQRSASQVQFAGTMLTLVGSIAGSAFRVARKRGVDILKIEKAAAERNFKTAYERLVELAPDDPVLSTLPKPPVSQPAGASASGAPATSVPLGPVKASRTLSADPVRRFTMTEKDGSPLLPRTSPDGVGAKPSYGSASLVQHGSGGSGVPKGAYGIGPTDPVN